MVVVAIGGLAAIIISGPGAGGEGRRFGVITGKGALVLPGFQTCRRLSPATRTCDLAAVCLTSEGVEVRARGAVAHKVGHDTASIVGAGR